MATIRKEVLIPAAPEAVWAAFADFGAVHTRLAPGFVTDAVLEEGVRVVTFANGLVAREVLVTMDHETRRLVYAVVGGRLAHHSAAFEVCPEDGWSRVVWTADLLPDAMAETIAQMMEAGCAAMVAALTPNASA